MSSSQGNAQPLDDLLRDNTDADLLDQLMQHISDDAAVAGAGATMPERSHVGGFLIDVGEMSQGMQGTIDTSFMLAHGTSSRCWGSVVTGDATQCTPGFQTGSGRE